MKKLYYLLSMAFIWSFGTVQAQCTNNYYVVNSNPWGQTFNQTAMTNVFGAPNWTQANFSTAAATIFAPSVCFVMLEGGDGNANALNTFLTNNLSAIETWVNNGGRLFINSAPNQGANINFGFGGTTLVYPSYSTPATAVNVNDPIFLGPYLPTATSYTGGYFSHASITGTGLGVLLTGDNGTILANKYWGSGIVFFGGITSPNFHSPNAEAINLWYNIFHYAANINLCATAQTLTAAFPIICPNTSTTINTGASQNNVNYYLRNDANNTVVDGPVAGTGSAITFNTGNLTSTTTFNVLAARDYGVDLPSTNDYVRFSAPFHAYTNEITIESWVYSSTGNFPWAGQSSAGADNMGTNVWIWHNNQFFVNDAGTWRAINLPVLTPGWTHITTVANPAGLFVYYNGTLVVSNAAGITGNIVNNASSIIDLGQDPRFPAGTAGRNSNTAFDNFRVWNYARTQAEISGSMSICLTGTEPGLAQNTKFDEGIGTSILSSTGSSANIINPSTNWITGSLTCFACDTELPQTVTVTVQDNAPTVVSSPSNITVNNDLGLCGAVLTYTAPTFDDDCDGTALAGNMTSGLASGATFPVGVTTVTYEYTDASAQSASTSFTVTVNDTENPTITAPAAVTVSADAGSCSATGVALGTPVTADNCTVASVTNNAPGSFPLGTTTVIWTVTDGSGNTATATQTVTVNDTENPTITAPTTVTVIADAASCLATGVALGTPATADNCTVASVTNNAPGSFPLGTTTVIWTVTDGAGNTATATQTVTVEDNEAPVFANVPAAITITANNIGCTGIATWTAPTATDNCAGGVTITTSHNAGDAFSLGVTTVTYTAEDAAGNISIASFTIEVINDLAVAGSVTDASCNGLANGEIEVTATGGVPTYSYDWTDGGAFSSTDEDLTGLFAGNYTLTVTDINGCTVVESFVVEEADAILITINTTTDPTSCGDTDGAIDISVIGGTVATNYSFSWTDGGAFSSTDEDLTSLAQGTYTITVTDDNGCTATESATLSDPQGALIDVVSVTDVLCNGDQGGAIDIDVTGGSPAYSYDWTDGGAFSSTDEDISNLAAGNYEVTVTDANNCVSTLTVTVNEPAVLSASATSTVETMGNDGSIDLTVTGGTAPFTYSWTGPFNFTSTVEDPANLIEGTYEVTVTDANGCTTTLQVVVGTIVGITEVNLIEFNLFPNPANDLYTISVTTSGTLEVYGNNGQLVSTEKIESGKTVKDVHQLSTGVYTIRFVNEQGVAVKRLVVNK